MKLNFYILQTYVYLNSAFKRIKLLNVLAKKFEHVHLINYIRFILHHIM